MSAIDSPLDQRPVNSLKGAGPRVAERLLRLGIRTVQDLLFHLPLRYQDRSRLSPLAALCPGIETWVEGQVLDAGISAGRRRSLKVWLGPVDLPTGEMAFGQGLLLRFFHFSAQQAAAFRPGERLYCYGEVRQGPQSLEMIHPEYRFQRGDPSPLSAHLTPVYPSTEGLSQRQWWALTEQALVLLERWPLAELLPPEVLAPLGLPGLNDALKFIHRPSLGTPLAELAEGRHPAIRRLAFEELVAQQASLRRLRRAAHTLAAPVLVGDGRLVGGLRASLPFQLTAAQERVIAEISADLKQPRPMRRLLQGDVGSGKTILAALAALQVVESGHQAALMAPTELLAEQHQRNLSQWLAPLGIAPVLLAGRHKGREREARRQAIASGEAQIVVGTHALIQEDVVFRGLGLIIIDEQHRFGVHQRLKLREKGRTQGLHPHQLIMTATPIPRSLAMTLYADLDLSVIDERPPGRTPVITRAVPDTRRDEVIERVRLACLSGRQAYWVCTLIEESEVLECQAAEETARELQARLQGVRAGLVHGRLKAQERDAVMGEFAAGRLDLLVATTVIEVGVDIPNASLMIIENPERLGLAQLHQLRGRVGRGAVESYCLLLYHPPLSEIARERLAIIRNLTDGFAIAERDLAMRGAGEVLGTRQSGVLQLRIAQPLRDQPLVAPAQRAADVLLDRYPEFVTPLIDRWLGEREHDGGV
ncbi:ATP-dependent DNA helicase RecG [Caldichromatium japonicum]|uniref:ATP-dependent DNA helicase RecG n=1 Tax=Caldichromatium japonicum TaxID=2699430 RepID=A0A6G7VFN1_9GAMM|nr:ATP-dependent DNA helicase RecG [Caldichromatium japonicum]QIK38675.1 ATP-dependent DNA helicase RecG [Caldichromatium japonicum]